MKIYSISILFQQMQNFGILDHSERNGAQNSKKDRNLPISDMLDLPYLNTTKVSLQVKYGRLLYSICILVLQMQNFGMLDHSEKNGAQNSKND